MKPVNLLFSAVRWHLSISENLALVVLVFGGGGVKESFLATMFLQNHLQESLLDQSLFWQQFFFRITSKRGC